MAREASKGLVKFDEFNKIVVENDKPVAKSRFEVNASAIKSVNHLVNSVLVPNVVDKDVTLFVDEAHELKHDVTNAFLTILSPGADVTRFSYNNYDCDFDHKRQSFFFATSEPHRVFPPLMDRMTRIDLADYSHEEMGKIVQFHAPEIAIDSNVLGELVTVLRGNARAAKKMSEDIKTYVHKRKAFLREDWDDLKEILGINPLGLNFTEIQILKYLSENTDGTSLTKLASKTGLSRESLQQDYELMLLKLGLMCVETTGRQITRKGLEYLRALPT